MFICLQARSGTLPKRTHFTRSCYLTEACVRLTCLRMRFCCVIF